jgi:nucleoside-diphosphate-sugar epimerase
MNVLITGGSGNLGRCIATELSQYGHRVTLFDRVEPSRAPAPWETDLPFVQGELTSGAACRAAVAAAQADVICHVGAIPYATDHPRSKQQRQEGTLPDLPDDETFHVNAMGTYYILDAAQQAGVKQVLFASTFFVLGLGFRISDDPWWPRYLPIDEAHPLTPEDTYSLSKVVNEEMLAAYTRAYGVRTVAFRLMGVYYAHRDDSARRFHQTADQSFGEGKPAFGAWLYVDGRDVAQAFRLAIEASNLEPHERFYLASDRTIAESPRDAVRRIFPNLRALTENLGPDDFLISIERARQRLGYEPRYSWRRQA